MSKRSPEEALAYFNTVHWTRLWTEASSYEAPKWANPTSWGRDTTNGFFMSTLNTKETVPHILLLVRKDLAIPTDTLSNDASPQTRRTPSVQLNPPDTVFLLKLGHGGLNGHGGLLHGGMISTLLDHSSGHAVAAHQKDPQSTAATLQLYTVHMSTSFFGPVRTDERVIAVLSWLIVKTSSKWWTRAQIVDGGGIVLAQADALWIVTKPKM